MTYRANLKIGPALGAGYFGEVFSAIDEAHGLVAVKVQEKLPFESDAQWQARRKASLAEGQRLSQARHPNVVHIHGLLERDTDDAVLIVMDHCPGGSLQDHFDAGPMRLGDVRRYMTQVAMGLTALHSRGMLHRDIKPGNILLNRKDVAQLGDFGLVTDDIVAGYASAAGYADHLAPEVINGGGTSIRSDIWALGMTMYRLLHGELWYSRLPPPRHVSGRGGFAKSLPWLPHIPQVWRTVIRTMMNDDSGARYQDGHALLQALSRLPTTPAWECDVAAGEITWTCEFKKRRYLVELLTLGPNAYSWEAKSVPVGAGNRRSFGGSTNVTYAVAERELVALFRTKLRLA
jgi:serine/threonine-protein kinase